MLNVLRQIVQEVNEAHDLHNVLQIMVKRISESIKVEACSVYLADKQQSHYRLVSSIGFAHGVDGVLTIEFSQGLVGLVGDREEPINISDARCHSKYLYFPETGEEKYKAFLGVPIIHQRKLVGVLVVQQREPRKFDEGEEAFLVTISAQLAGIVAHAQMAGMVTDLWKKSNAYTGTVIRGVGASPGVAIGHAVIYYMPADLDAVPDRAATDFSLEKEKLKNALLRTQEDIEKMQCRVRQSLPPEEQSLFAAYAGILKSQSLISEMEALIDENHWAPFALRKVFKDHVRRFEAVEDPYLRERAADLLDLGRRVLSHLQSETPAITHWPKDTILVSEELTASALAEVPEGRLKGIVSSKGSANSHVAILAKAMGIPAVMGTSGLPLQCLDNIHLVVDGYNGEVFTQPSPAMLQEFSRLAEEEKELYAGLNELRELRAETPDGVRVALCVNTGLVADIRPSLQVGAEGIGLYRTEIPFMIRDRFPGEEEQYLIYRQLLETFHPRPVSIRTLDIGGDKALPYFPVKESNPFLGWRGIRVTLDHPEIFILQLRAMLRANSGLNNLRILLPMISGISEVDDSLRLVRQAYQEIIEEGALTEFPPIGVMMEVPSSVFQAGAIAKRVDFLSVGTNDLTQYLLAVDRNNSYVANLYDSLHPAVLQALKMIVDGAHMHGKPVSVCGEMAGDPSSVIALLGMGFDMLSMNATNLPKIKWVIRNFTIERAKLILKECLLMDNAPDVRLKLESVLEEAGLGGLVRAGK